MTGPFKNDSSTIVKRISNRSISANRKRNIFIVLTIALASALLSAIVLYGFGVMQETQNRNQKTAQIMYHAISEQQGQELYKQEEIAWVGEFFNAFSPFNREFYLCKCRYAKIPKYALFGRFTSFGE